MFTIKTVEEIYGYESKPEVLDFIKTFMQHSAKTTKEQEVLRHTFRAGYCYYFAGILKSAFERGKICWAAPYSHIVWMDDNGCPYDIEGVCPCDTAYYIPVQYMGKYLQGFMNTKQNVPYIDWDNIIKIIRDYEKANNLPAMPLQQINPTFSNSDKPLTDLPIIKT